jgi:hypothetical protein
VAGTFITILRPDPPAPGAIPGEPYYLFLQCDPGGNQAPWLLGFFVSRESDGYCQRDDVLAGPFDQANVDHAACVAAVNASGYCQ